MEQDLREDLTSSAPAHLQDKLYWAGMYRDECTDGQIECGAQWEEECSEADCQEMDDFFREKYGDELADITHTGHCPEGRWPDSA